jgi:hypothetical protein
MSAEREYGVRFEIDVILWAESREGANLVKDNLGDMIQQAVRASVPGMQKADVHAGPAEEM